ncbi:hypothetical protein GDO86_001652 [Hymenochirus boettgeri]|uniref:NEDD4-binding protein 1 n=1 Tax=Hymenochirus boettgeri TaxID=247094 RepID=A0A8T2KMD5_9PIPI|nr:hypothetical protein GDO86_001652 [Hymenochirus boettgeri]
MLMDVEENEAAQYKFSMDEFTVPLESERELQCQRPNVERIFGVVLNILGVLDQTHLLQSSTEHQQMWLQLQGERQNLEKAKDYIKGLCTPEVTEELDYPREMHCIFGGAKGIFLDCLIRTTSACLKPLAPGRIRISGLAEGAVMAQSWVSATVEKCQSSTKPCLNEAQIKRTFRDLVENYSDKHALDLLILPTSIKAELLILVDKHVFDNSMKVTKPNELQSICENHYSVTICSHPSGSQKNQTFEKNLTSNADVRNKSKSGSVILHQRASEPREVTGANPCTQARPFPTPTIKVTGYDAPHHQDMDEREITCKDENEKLWKISGFLDNFMGREMGDQRPQKHFSMGTQREFNMLLDFFKSMGYQESVVLKVLSENGIQEPSQILDKVNIEQYNTSQTNVNQLFKELSQVESSKEDDDDVEGGNYVLEVVKSAARTCGYSTSEILDIENGSVEGLLRKLNERNILENDKAFFSDNNGHNQEPAMWLPNTHKPEVRAEIATGTVVETLEVLNNNLLANNPVEDYYPGLAQQEVGLIERTKDSADSKEPCVPVVTGVQRFNEAMQTPFQLNLRNEKGKEDLRYVIIDGSNVAMIHGLHRFFSCRGIALAVQYFWDQGHRSITVFVPQWRMRKDSKVKEQHFLTELNDIGLLSFTPSRTIEGKRVTSYDDRFMLQLAEKTDSVIVTNDNLRDIAAESQAWKTIIKERLLQFTFVGDIFMVPDDPLGRNGPPLNQFLSKSARPRSKSKGHSFAGRRGPHSSPKKTSQTEVLNYRDRKPFSGKEEVEAGARSFKETQRLRHELLNIFPSQDENVDYVLQSEPCQSDLNKLSELIITLNV